MDNKPQFIIIWLACLAIDALPAFINYNLVEEGLAHCVTVSKAKILIYDSTFTTQISAATPLLLQALPSLQLVSWTDQFSTPTKASTSTTETTATSKFDDVITSNPSQLLSNSLISLNASKLLLYPSTPIPNSRRSGLTWQSPAFLIFTSGSTGLPKTAICTHGRTKTGMIMYSRINGFNEHNRIYTPMPLYHSTAAILAIAVSWNCGAKVIIGRKFSATKFWFVFFSFLFSLLSLVTLLLCFALILFYSCWFLFLLLYDRDEVRRHDANVIQYVGEVLRYLLAVPPSPLDKQHKVKLAYGNGCRPDIWEKFRDRFGVDTISEFFASSEGNGSLFNKNSNLLGAGAVGHEGTLSGWARKKDQPIIKVDPLTEEPERDSNGFCIRVSSYSLFSYC